MVERCKHSIFYLLPLIGLLTASCAGYQPVPKAKHHGAGSARPVTTVSQSEQHCLALNLYWEARGEGRSGMVAVGWTVLNRVRSDHFPSTPCGVVRQGGERPPCQFSWWCDGRSDQPRERDSWRAALAVSEELLHNPPGDPTGGALFYHSTKIKTPWKRKRSRTAKIGRHIFYR